MRLISKRVSYRIGSRKNSLVLTLPGGIHEVLSLLPSIGC